MAIIWDPNAKTDQMTQNISDRLASGIQQLSNIKLSQLLEKQQYQEQQRRAAAERSRLENVLKQTPGGLSPQSIAILANTPQVHWGKTINALKQAELMNQLGKQQGQVGQSEQQQVDLASLMQQYPERKASMAPPGQPLTQETAIPTDLNAQAREQARQKAKAAAPTISPQGQLAEEQIAQMLPPKEQMKYLQSKKQEEFRKWKTSKPLVDETFKASSAAKQDTMSLKRMDKLNNTDKLVNPYTYAALEKMGLNVPALLNKETQEFQEIVSNFLRNAKNIFGARVTNFEMDRFMKTLPTLMNSKEGRAAIIRNLKLYREAAIVREDALKQILKENKGVPPYDLQVQIEERIEDKIDDISKRFEYGQEEEQQTQKAPVRFETLPSAAQYPGKKIVREETGEVLISDGKSWKKVG